MEDLERLNKETPINIINVNEDTQKINQLIIIEENDDLKLYNEFLNKVDKNKKIELTDFNLYKKIKTDHQIHQTAQQTNIMINQPKTESKKLD